TRCYRDWSSDVCSSDLTRTGGIAGEIAALVCEGAFEDLDGPVLRVTSLDTPVPYSPPLDERFLPDVRRVAAAARDLATYRMPREERVAAYAARSAPVAE